MLIQQMTANFDRPVAGAFPGVLRQYSFVLSRDVESRLGLFPLIPGSIGLDTCQIACTIPLWRMRFCTPANTKKNRGDVHDVVFSKGCQFDTTGGGHGINAGPILAPPRNTNFTQKKRIQRILFFCGLLFALFCYGAG